MEDSLIVCKNLRLMLLEYPGTIIVGYAAGETEAIRGIDTLLPDVVILDLRLESGYGLNVLEDIKKRHAAIKVMVLTNLADEFYANHCKHAGADYFFDKSFQFSQIVSTLRMMDSCPASEATLETQRP